MDKSGRVQTCREMVKNAINNVVNPNNLEPKHAVRFHRKDYKDISDENKK